MGRTLGYLDKDDCCGMQLRRCILLPNPQSIFDQGKST